MLSNCIKILFLYVFIKHNWNFYSLITNIDCDITWTLKVNLKVTWTLKVSLQLNNSQETNMQ